ncbi:MAG: SDR family oxidoreductase [Bacteroidetes bacterium]|nr:MAG: SDR family oxidoreductase [Bacteroidota bacterium]
MNHNPFTLAGKTIFITGASSGIGRAIAVEASRMGATLLISGRNSERLGETFSLLRGDGHEQHIADLNDEQQTTEMITRLPSLDGVVHAAGIITSLPFQFITREKLEEIFSVNFISPTLLSKELVKQKKLNKNASFVWISSISGFLCGSPGHSLYSSTKAAVNGMVKGMAIDLARKGIRVNSINPGQIATPLFDEGVISSEQMQQEMQKYPLKRFGKPEEVAYAAIYLLSDASAWTTGSHLVLDGGFTLL